MRQTHIHITRAKRTVASTVIACLVLTLVRGPMALVPMATAASTFRPTIFVNTEAFLAIDDDDTSADVVLRFGDTLAKTLIFNRSLDRFEFNDDVYVTGTIQASNTVSGAVVYGAKSLRSSGSLVWEGIGSGGKLFVKNFLSVGSRASGSLLTVGRVGSGTNIATATNATLFSTDQMALGQLEGGAYFGRVGLKENQWGLSNYGNMWTAKDIDRNWTDIAMSSDGKIQTATVYLGQIYVSRDYGNTWTAKGGSDWQSVAMSADGKVQTATVYGGQAYVSFDYGDTWTAKGPTIDWFENTMSSDGRIQAAVTDGGLLHVSADYGATWVAKESSRNWDDIAMSSDGKVLSATVSAGRIYISFDYGNTWTAKDIDRNWTDIAMSSDAKIQTATVSSGQVYVSRDYGNTWVAKDSSRVWNGIAMSGDGKIQAATVIGGQIYISTDYGNTWSAKESSRDWSPIAMSSDGKVMTAAVNKIGGGQIYVSYADSYQYGSVAIGTGSVKGSTKLMVQGIFSGVTLYATRSFSGAGLSDCDTGATSKLLWDATTGRFSCGTDQGAAYTAGQGLSLAGTSFKLNAFHTGSVIQASTTLASSGTLVWEGIGSGSSMHIGGGTIQIAANGSAVFNENSQDRDYRFEGDTDANLMFMDASTDSVGIGTVTPKAKLSVAGTISGVTVYATQSFSGAGLSDCDTGATSKLLWDATTGRFSCGTDQTGGVGGNWSNTGSLQTYFDNRYVNTSGDTMTGALRIEGRRGYQSGSLLIVSRVGSGSHTATATNATLFSTDQMALGQLEGGGFFGRVGLKENQWGLSNYGNTWTAKESNRNWTSIAMSSDGKIQTAVAQSEQIYVSSDYGNTWAAKDSSRVWQSIAMSSDGKIQTAGVSGGQIYTSSDYGNTWTAKDSSRDWYSVAMSSDGRIQISGVYGGQIYISNNYGNTWTAKDSNRDWESVAMSSDGKIQSAVAYNNKIYISSDYGNTWTAKDSSRQWQSVAMSSDGKIQTATVNAGQIYVSSDYGNTWTAKESSRDWREVTMSSDGKVQTAGVYNGQLYVSSDYGNTWTAKESTRNWINIAMSSDGKIQTAIVTAGQIYVSYADSYQYGSVAIGTGSVKGNTKLMVQGILSGVTLYATKSFSGAGLSDCDTGATSKLLWDATTGRFSCGTDQTGGVGGNWSNTGSLQTYFDNRYVNTSGDTMTGALTIQNGTAHSDTLTSLFNVRGTMSGKSLVINGGGYFQGGNGDVNGDGSQTSADLLMLVNYFNGGGTTELLTSDQYARADVNGDSRVDGYDYYMINNYALMTQSENAIAKHLSNTAWTLDLDGDFGIGTRVPDAKLDVIGSISGASLVINGGGEFSGSVGVGRPASTHSTFTASGSFATRARVMTATGSINGHDNIIFASGSSMITITLPTAVGITGRQYTIKKTSATTDTNMRRVIVATTSSQTIDRVANWKLLNRGQQVTVVSDGANWQVVDASSYGLNGGFISMGTTMNQWYGAPADATALTTAVLTTTATIRALPFVAQKVMTINGMSVSVQTTAANASVRLALYNDSGRGYPDQLVVDAGAVATTATGQRSICPSGCTTTGSGSLPVTIQPGLYWIALNNNSIAVTLRGYAVANLNPVSGFPSAYTTLRNVGWQVTSNPMGAFPSTFPTAATATTAVPLPAVTMRFQE